MIVVPTLHPGQVLRGGEGFDAFSKFDKTVEADFKKAHRLRWSVPTWNEDIIWQVAADGRYSAMFPTEADVISFFSGLTPASELTVDVETTGATPLDCQLICVGLGYVDGQGFERVLCIPFLSQGGFRYWDQAAEIRIAGWLRWAMAEARIAKLFHNGQFDCSVLMSQGFLVGGWLNDSMLAHHALDSELPHNLGFVGSLYLDARYWKDDVKGGDGWLQLPDLTLRSYNLKDVLITLRVKRPLLEALRAFDLFDTYSDDMALARDVMMRASWRGVFVDAARRTGTNLDAKGKPEGLRPQLELQKAAALGALRAIAWPEFEPNKPSHLQHLFFNLLRFPIVKISKKTGKPVIDREALMLMELRADDPKKVTALKQLISYRQADKFIGTFVDGMEPLGDGAVHVSWKLSTNSGRLASSPNAQNWSRKVKKMFRARVGHKLVSADLSQAELRLIAYFARDEELLRMYREGLNVHTVNATLLFQVRCPKPDDTNTQTEAYLREVVPKLLGEKFQYDNFPMLPVSQWKETRTLAKVFVFAGNYGAEAETVHRMLRSKRDPDTAELLFPKIELGEIEALQILWKKLHPALPAWWDKISRDTERRGHHRCPIGKRVRWFRAGFKRNEMLNAPIQGGVASWVNKCTILIQQAYDQETGGAAQIISQVHDALTAEVPESYAQRAAQIMEFVLNRKFELFGIESTLPTDKATITDYLA